jgi:hypothetical protein
MEPGDLDELLPVETDPARQMQAAKLEIQKQLSIFDTYLLSAVEQLKLEVVTAAVTELCALAKLNACGGQQQTIYEPVPSPTNNVHVLDQTALRLQQRMNTAASTSRSIKHSSLEKIGRGDASRRGSVEFGVGSHAIRHSAAMNLTPARKTNEDRAEEVASIMLQAEMLENARSSVMIKAVQRRRNSVAEAIEGTKDVVKRLFAVAAPTSQHSAVKNTRKNLRETSRSAPASAIYTGAGVPRSKILNRQSSWVPRSNILSR